MENLCNNCIHKDVCGRYVATWGMKSCENFMEMPKKGLCKKSKNCDEWYGHYYHCFECGTNTMVATDNFTEIAPRLCPYCGADMRGDQCE